MTAIAVALPAEPPAAQRAPGDRMSKEAVRTSGDSLRKRFARSRLLLVMFLPGLLYYLVFRYWPMYGLVIAFKKFDPFLGVARSPWVGLRYYIQFLADPFAWRIIRNTFLLSTYSLLWGFPAPIILAILLNELRSLWFKKTVQTIVYLPHFISEVVIIGILVNFLSPGHGVVNRAIVALGGEPIYFMGEPGWFRTLYVSSGIWQNVGWGAIIYIAALAGINPELYEAAIVDGASRWRRIKHVTMPGILPTVMVMLVLRLGHLLTVGFEKVLLMYSPATYETADIISTYVYRVGLLNVNYSYASAVGLMNNVVNLALVVMANSLSRRTTEASVW